MGALFGFVGPLANVALKVVMSMLARLCTAEAIEWALRKAARQYVDSTETKADDKWLEGLEKHLDKGK